MEAAPAQSLLIITGSMGSGKTVVLGEASDILTARGIPHAAIDLDMLVLAHLPVAAENDDVMYRILNSVWHNYVDHGVDRLLLARAVEDHHELERCLAAVAAKALVVCRLTASIKTMQRRVASRELGICRDEYIGRVATLNAALDQSPLENFVVSSEGRPITEVAIEVLQRARWL
jgi:cytidylate kinase